MNTNTEQQINKLLLQGGHYFITKKEIDIEYILTQLIDELNIFYQIHHLKRPTELIFLGERLKYINKAFDKRRQYKKVFNHLMTIYINGFSNNE